MSHQLGVGEKLAEATEVMPVAAVKVTSVPLLDRILLLGPPGIGKTEIIRQKAEEEARRMGRIFIDIEEELRKGTNLKELYKRISEAPEKYYLYFRLVATHVSREDLSIIYPDVETESALPLPQLIFKLFSLRRKDCKGSDRECAVAGTLFIDEITNVADPSTVTLFYALIQEKRVSWGVKMPDTVKIVAAGNSPRHSSAARLLPAPLVNRMTVVEVEPPTLGEWISYMLSRYRGRFDYRVVEFLIAKAGGNLDANDVPCFVPLRVPRQTLSNFPSPRSWTRLALQLKELSDRGELTEELVYTLAVGAVGETCGAQFYAYWVVSNRVEEPAELLRHPEKLLARATEVIQVEAVRRTREGEERIKTEMKIPYVLAAGVRVATHIFDKLIRIADAFITGRMTYEAALKAIDELKNMVSRFSTYYEKAVEKARKNGIEVPEETKNTFYTIIGMGILKAAEMMEGVTGAEQVEKVRRLINYMLDVFSSEKSLAEIAERIKTALRRVATGAGFGGGGSEGLIRGEVAA